MIDTERVKDVLGVSLRLCVLEILSNRVRTVITSFGIFLGVASLLANLAFIRGMQEGVRRDLETIGGLNVVMVRSVDPATQQERMRFQQSRGLSLEEVQHAAEGLSQVRAVLPQIETGRLGVAYKGKGRRGRVVAVAMEHRAAFNYEVGKGRWFSLDEMARGLDVCVIGEKLAEGLFGKDVDPLGQSISIRRIPVRIVGVMQGQSIYDSRTSQCLIPYSMYQARFAGYHRHTEEVAVLLDNPQHGDAVQRELTARLLALHRGVKDFEVETNRDKIREQQKAMGGLEAILWCIAAISLLVGGISIMNIMFATIGDRIREIGVRKALGARREDIFTQFILEAVLVCFVGGTPGMALGAGVTLAPAGFFPFNPVLSVGDYALALAFTVIAGLVSGIFPAFRAANMEPVEALRY